MRKPIKRAAIRSLKLAGLESFIAGSKWRQERLAILCYHGVALEDEHEWDPLLFVDSQHLERRLQLLLDGGFQVLPLGEGVRRMYEGTLPPKSVAITFDDGCYDFYRRAVPVLEKYGVPATVYLTTWYCFHPFPVFPISLHYLLWKGRNSFQGGRVLGLDCPVDLHSKAGRIRLVETIAESAQQKGLSVESCDALWRQLAQELGVDYERILQQRIIQLMKPEEVSQLAAKGVDIQLHTHRHRTPRDRALFMREIEDNRRHIREMTGGDAVHFCYPSGVYFPEFYPWLREKGVLSATTCVSGLASREMDAMELPRIVDTCSLTDEEFAAAVAGVTTGYLPRPI